MDARILCVAAWFMAAGQPALAVMSYDPLPDADPSSFVVVNLHLGADRFYDAGYFGQNAVVANVEAGHVWNGHESLNRSLTYVHSPTIDPGYVDYDGHATAVGFTIAGLGPPNAQGNYYYYQMGMAPFANLISTAIASQWIGSNGSFEITGESFIDGYRSVMQDGVSVPYYWNTPSIRVTRTANVVNSSWGFDDPTGSSNETKILDALAYANHTAVVRAAGNHSTGEDAKVVGTSSGYNGISVAALQGGLNGSSSYGQIADFSNSGPIDFRMPATNTVISGVRCGVDIAAPGTDLVLAAYTGTTGSNTGGTDPYALANDLYYIHAAGTSFASPIVAGGAALLVDAGYDQFAGNLSHAIDGRTLKAVLLNSATKTAGWTQNLTMTGGIWTTTQSLDYHVGAGKLNLYGAYDQYLSGTTDLPTLTGGTVQEQGWDFGQAAAGAPNDYLIAPTLTTGQTLTATLTWFVNRSFNDATDTASDVQFSNLDLQLWQVFSGQPQTLIAQSVSLYNNVEHLNLLLTQGGQYLLRVLWAGEVYDLASLADQEDYAIAWNVAYVPEPATCGLLLTIGAILGSRRSRLA